MYPDSVTLHLTAVSILSLNFVVTNAELGGGRVDFIVGQVCP